MPTPSSDFYSPRLSKPLVRFCQMLAPWVATSFYRLDLEVDYEGLNHLIGLRDRRVLLLPNHPTFQDPIALFLLSGKLGQTFYYLAAYEQFQGILGRFFQFIGGYSIRRGLADRASITQTLDLLAQPDCHLVIFAEGGCSFQNDTVMPFRAGAVQLAFQAMNRLVKQGQPVPDLYVVPISLKYRYTQNMAPVIEQTLSSLEATLGLPGGTGNYERLRAIAEKILIQIEQEYAICPPDAPHLTWNDRIALLKTYVLQTCEQQLALTPMVGEPDRERVYKILNALQVRENNLESGQGEVTQPWDEEFVEKSMMRLLNFDAIYDGYVAANPTPERFLDTLVRLEREVYGIERPAPKGHHLAQLKIATPVNLKDSFAAFQANKTATVESLVQQFQQTVQTNLDQLNAASTTSYAA